MNASENKSALDYYYWNNKLLYLTSNRLYSGDFERNFQNAVILSKNNSDIQISTQTILFKKYSKIQ